MPLNVKDPRMHALARRLARITGETMTEAVRTALQERLKRVEAQQPDRPGLADRLDEIARHSGALPVRRRRMEDEILGYNAKGLPDV